MGVAHNRCAMQIFITLLPSGRKVTAEVEGSDSVEALRRQIHELASPLLGAAAGSAAPGQQLLVFNEAVLEDGKTLADYDILKESELRVSLRPKQVPIRLDVGGSCFSVTLDTLCAVSGSRLAAMFEPVAQGGTPVEVRAAVVSPDAPPEGVPYEAAEPLPQGADGAWLIDRDGLSFRYVLNYLRARRPVFRNGQLVKQQPQDARPEPKDAVFEVGLKVHVRSAKQAKAACVARGIKWNAGRAERAVRYQRAGSVTPGVISELCETGIVKVKWADSNLKFPITALFPAQSDSEPQPEPQDDDDGQENLRMYARQHEMLMLFHAMYDPAKTAVHITAILDKCKGDAACVPEQNFTEMLGTLQTRYGGDAMGLWRSYEHEEQVDKREEIVLPDSRHELRQLVAEARHFGLLELETLARWELAKAEEQATVLNELQLRFGRDVLAAAASRPRALAQLERVRNSIHMAICIALTGGDWDRSRGSC